MDLASDRRAVGRDSLGPRLLRLAITAAALSLVAPLASSVAGAQAPASWLVRGAFPTIPREVNAVACPTTAACVAVGGTYAGLGIVLRTSNGGATWTQASLPSTTGELSDVTCPTALRCEATVLDAYYRNVQIIASSDGGATWSSQSVASGADVSDLETVRCASAMDCVATGSGGEGEATVLATTDGGATWASISPFGLIDNVGIEGVSCTSSTDCLITGWAAGGSSTQGVASFTTNGGLTWTQGTVPSDVEVAWELACTSATSCVAPARTSGGAAMLSTADGGATWHELALPSGEMPLFVACSSTTVCDATGIFGPSFGPDRGLLLASADGGTSWSRVALPHASAAALGLSCPSTTTCVVPSLTVKNVPAVYSVTGGTASATNLKVTGPTQLSALTCPTPTECIAAGTIADASRGDVGGLLTTANAGASWTPRTTQSAAVELTGVACPTPQSCAAVGPTNPYSGTSVVVTSANGGASWSRAATSPFALNAIECRAANDCVAVGLRVLYDEPGTGGHWRYGHLPSSVGLLGSVACPTAVHCVAVGGDFGVGVAVVSNDGGRTWQIATSPKGPFTMRAVACPTASLCVAVGDVSSISGTGAPSRFEVSTDGGATWRVARAPQALPDVYSIACLNARLCYAGGASATNGVVLRSTDEGASWSYVPAPAGAASVTLVSCGRSGCWLGVTTPTGVIELEAAR